MEAQLAVITGASGDLGSALCTLIAARGIGVVLMDRNAKQANALAAALNERSPGCVKGCVVVDLADHADIQRGAQELLKQHPRIDYLFNNAGVLTESMQFSKHGNELHFEVNALAPLRLIDLLRPALRNAGAAVVVNTTAGLALSVNDLSWNNLVSPKAFTKLFGPYTKSKQALNVLTSALSRELLADDILVRAVDPGPNRTRLTKGAGTPLWMRMFASFLPSPTKGARKIFDAAFDERWGKQTGLIISDGKSRELPTALGDPAFGKDFLAMCRSRASLIERD